MNAIKKQSNNIITIDEETKELIKKTVAVGATDTELQLFLYYAQKTGLDPLARQLYFMKRRAKVGNVYEDKMTIQTSIDGFRLIAQRSGEYAGQSKPEFIYKNNAPIPMACEITIYKFAPNGERYPASVGTAYWTEYCPQAGQDFMWRKMPHTMLAKTAEAIGLRKAFPQELSGLYTDEEMEQANTLEEKKPKVVEVKKLTTEEIRGKWEKWVSKIPEKFASVEACENINQYKQEKQELKNSLLKAKANLNNFPDLLQVVEEYLETGFEDIPANSAFDEAKEILGGTEV